MRVTVYPCRLSGKAEAIASKSYAHRALIAAALSPEPTKIFLNASSEDIEATKRCLSALGVGIAEETGAVSVSPVKEASDGACLACGESGSTARFLLPVAAVLSGGFSMTGEGRLPMRPMEPLINEMKRHGVFVSSLSVPLFVKGRLPGGEYVLPGNISSQYITGLLLALSALPKKSSLSLSSPLESGGYVDMTLDVLKKFGVDIKKEKDTFYIPGGGYSSPKETVVEGDWSNAAFWICASAMGCDIEVEGLDTSSLQGDKRIINEVNNTSINAADIPDLVPALAARACQRKGNTVIYNASRLRLKESDRIKTTAESLRALGAKIYEREDGLLIEGTGSLFGGRCFGYGDHRIVMACAIASVICKNPVIIDGAEAVNKSYPSFFQTLASLGAKVVIE